MKHTFELQDGLQVEGSDARTEVIMREPTSGDIFSAREDAEVIKGDLIVESQARYEKAIAYRMIESIGGAPITPLDIDRLSFADYQILIVEMNKVYGGGVKKVAQETRARQGESKS